MAVNALVVEDAENNKATDVYKLASELHEQYPQYKLDNIVAVIEIAVVGVGGSAVWNAKTD